MDRRRILKTDAEYAELARDIIAKHSTIDVATLDREVQRELRSRNTISNGTLSFDSAGQSTGGVPTDER